LVLTEPVIQNPECENCNNNCFELYYPDAFVSIGIIDNRYYYSLVKRSNMEKQLTALQQSIQRKKDRIEWFKTTRTSDKSLYMKQEDELLKQIAEDEKLLEVDEADRDNRDRMLIDRTWAIAHEDNQVPSTSTQNDIIEFVNETYQIDGNS
jgi:hypothetical protein